MKSPLLCFACSALIAVCLSSAPRAQEARLPAEQGPTQEQQMRGGIVTLYALDPLARAFCFHDGREGFMLRNDRVVKRCAGLGFSLAGGGTLVIGPEANRVVALVDLGTASDIRTRYGYDDASGVEIGFASVRLHGGKLAALVQKEDRPQEKVEPLREAQALSFTAPSANAPVSLGHIYVLRIADTKDSNFQLLVKLMVIAYTPNETVTLRWQLF